MSEANETPLRPREFIPVEDQQEALSLLTEGAKTFSSAMIWTKDQAQVLNTHLNSIDEKQKNIIAWIPTGFDLKRFRNALDDTGTTDCYFSVSLPRANIFFKSSLSEVERDGLKFKFPDTIFKVQRRKELRLSLSEAYGLFVEFGAPVEAGSRIKKRMVDISASGLGIFISDEERGGYRRGTILRDVAFTLHDRKFICEAEVRHIRPLQKPSSIYEKHKVGLLFRNLRAGETQTIAAFVFEESRKFYSRFI